MQAMMAGNLDVAYVEQPLLLQPQPGLDAKIVAPVR